MTGRTLRDVRLMTLTAVILTLYFILQNLNTIYRGKCFKIIVTIQFLH